MKNFLLLLFIMIPFTALADNTLTAISTGDIFPDLYAQDLTDEFITLPAKAEGKISLLAVSFSRPEEGVIESWTKPFADEFKGNSNTAYYEIAMIGDVGWVSIFIFNGIKGGTKEDKKKNVLVFWEKTKDDFKKIFNVTDDKLIYVYLLDKKGRIKFMKSGEKAMSQDIQEILETALLLASNL